MKMLTTFLVCLLPLGCMYAKSHHKSEKKKPVDKIKVLGLAEYSSESWEILFNHVVRLDLKKATGTVKWGGDVSVPQMPYSFLLNRGVKYSVKVGATGVCVGSFNLQLEAVGRDGIQTNVLNVIPITDDGSGFSKEVVLPLQKDYPFFLRLKVQPLSKPPVTVRNPYFKLEIS